MDINKIKELAEVYLQEQVDLLMRFTSVDSESNYVEGNRQVIDMARAVLETIPGVTMEEMFFEGCGTHLIARINPEHPEGKIILNSHMDTVVPVGYAAKFPPYVDEDDWLHGLGSGDCKAGFAVSAYAVKIASELGLLPNKEIVMLYSCDEEIGSITSRKVFEKEAPGTECAYIFESAAKTDKGYGVVHMEFCVAGLPDNGPSFAEAEANIESLAASNEDPVCETTVSHRILFPALEKNEMGHKAFQIAEKAGQLLGITMEEIAEPTATDANWFYSFGVPAVDAFGPVESGMHTTEEKVYIPTITEKTALFAAMLGIMKEDQ